MVIELSLSSIVVKLSSGSELWAGIAATGEDLPALPVPGRSEDARARYRVFHVGRCFLVITRVKPRQAIVAESAKRAHG